MEQKLKIVAMALLALLFISFFLYFQTGNAKRMVEKERDSLRIDNDSLNKKLGDVMQEGKKMQDKIAALNSDLDRVSKERTEIQKKLDTASKEKSDLAEQIKALQAKKPEAAPAPAPAVEQQPLSQPADSYWAGILKSKTELELQIQNVRRELKSVQITSDQLQKEKSALALEVKNLTREKSDLKRQLDYNQKMMDSIGVELVR
ncbi:MAG: hypothetical protein ACM3IL_01895, partial [Deltaproteobacteria bacterium]